MASFKNKLELYKLLQSNLVNNLVITGSTALQLYGLTAHSSPYDLDLIIYDKDYTDNVKNYLLAIHSVSGTNKHYDVEQDEREVGTLFSMLFKGIYNVEAGGVPITYYQKTIEISVHLFIMKEEKRPQVSMKIDKHWYYLASPMNIIEAKKYMGRKKDFADLAKMCGRIITPMPEKVAAIDACEAKSTNIENIKM